MLVKIDSDEVIRNLDRDVFDEDRILYDKFCDTIQIDSNLTRKIVSFQGNKNKFFYSFFRYKEAFSYSLVKYCLEKYKIDRGIVLDPFCGIGTSVFTSSSMGLDAIGIELLPIGIKVCDFRNDLCSLSINDTKYIKELIDSKEWKKESFCPLNELRITYGAYPEKTEFELSQFIQWTNRQSKRISNILFFVTLSILEDISYTQKDGQYLRWDCRAEKKKSRGSFQKRKILDFESALHKKIEQIYKALEEDELSTIKGGTKFIQGSCLDQMKSVDDNSISLIITSPPYCNRYDYTRTYALELAMLGVSESKLVELRQGMLSCTVENKEKAVLKETPQWNSAIKAADECRLLQSILNNLDYKLSKKILNNNGIARMVRGYFYEMSCLIFECYRTLEPGSLFIMVNDNVKYAGINISVDLILSNIAYDLGFSIENILVLPHHKGNSSQQMGVHGRSPLRKCVYVWRKPDD